MTDMSSGYSQDSSGGFNWSDITNLFGGVGGMGLGFYTDREKIKSNEKMNAANIAFQREANKLNYEMQKEFAQSGISWKVNDARNAGLHPLAALGAQVYNANPSYIAPTVESNMRDVEGQGQNFKNMMNAISTVINPIERQKDLEAVKNMKLNNDLLYLQKQRELKDFMSVRADIGPEGIIGNGGQADGVVYEPNNITMKWSEDTQAGIKAGLQYVSQYGMVRLLPTQENQELITEMNPHALEYWGDWVQTIARDSKARIDPRSPAASKYREYLLRIKPKDPPGYHYRYVSRMRWKKYKNGPRGEKWFYNDKFMDMRYDGK